jgi:protein-arginine kinase activator protein McsA
VKLKEGLEEALKREDYEKAARIRDRIRELEGQVGAAE